MSLYDRDYMKPSRGGFPNASMRTFKLGFGAMSAVKLLILVNVSCFILGSLFDAFFGAGTFFYLFELTPSAITSGRVWTLLTYSFLHADFFHIFMNMLGLFFLGMPLEKIVGTRRFYLAYFFGALLGGALWLAISWNANEGLVGASAAVMSVFACFCAVYPPMPITFLLFFIIPVSMRPMTMLKIAAAIEVFGLIFSLSGGVSVIVYSAHLGGMAAGLSAAYLFRRGFASKPLFSRSKFDFFKKPSDGAGQNVKSATDYKYSVNISSDSSSMSRRVDEILDKINAGGFASLTDEEKEFLKKAREQMK